MGSDRRSKNRRGQKTRRKTTRPSRPLTASRRAGVSPAEARRQAVATPPPEDTLRCFYEVVPDGATLGSLADKKLRVTRRILFLGRRWRNVMDEVLRLQTGDNHARWVTLLWVDMMAGRANLGELAEQIAVELPTLVRLLNRLEREGMLVRKALDGSNRDKTVVLTAKGKRALIPMSALINRTQASFLEGLDEQRLDGALELLDEVLAKYAHIVMWPGNSQ